MHRILLTALLASLTSFGLSEARLNSALAQESTSANAPVAEVDLPDYRDSLTVAVGARDSYNSRDSFARLHLGTP